MIPSVARVAGGVLKSFLLRRSGHDYPHQRRTKLDSGCNEARKSCGGMADLWQKLACIQGRWHSLLVNFRSPLGSLNGESFWRMKDVASVH
jgi:hypothetical protein